MKEGRRQKSVDHGELLMKKQQDSKTQVRVRRDSRLVIGIGCISTAGVLCLLILMRNHDGEWGKAFIMLAAWMLLPFALALLDYLTYKVDFTKTEIRYRSIFAKHSYPYSDIMKVSEYTSSKMARLDIYLRSRKEKTLSISKNCKGFSDARAELLRHTSIRPQESYCRK